MPRVNPRSFSGRTMSAQAPYSKRDNYASQGGTIRRHEFTASAPTHGALTLLPNEYFVQEIIKFKRSFNAGVADTPPTPTASNNYQSTGVFNGSKVANCDTVIRIKNTSTTVPATIDIYEVSLSFYDSIVWDTIKTATCPLTMGVAGNQAGEMTWKAVTNAIVLENDHNNFRFTQHYLKKVGTVTIGNSDQDNLAEFRVRNIPPKNRRSQTGNMFAYIFHNPSEKNAAGTLSLTYNVELKFDEYPTENRLPFID